MTNDIVRKGHTGEAGNRGEFGTHRRDDSAVTLTAIAEREPFKFNGDFDDKEQVRAFYPAYLDRLEELRSAGQYPYNDSFKGHIVGLDSVSSRDEDTAIYMLQQLKSIEEMEAKLGAFDGAPLELGDGETVRGDVAVYGWYVGGTGFKVHEDVRVTRNARGSIVLIPKGRRNGIYPEGKFHFRAKA